MRTARRSELVIKADVSRATAVEKMVKSTVDRFGSVDILVANAGIWKEAAIDSMTEREWDETLNINLKSIYACCREAARVMIPRRRGTMILISSTAGQRGEARHSHYAATKGATISMTKSLASELGPRGITVNCVAPGWVATDMAAEALSDPKHTTKGSRFNTARSRRHGRRDCRADSISRVRPRQPRQRRNPQRQRRLCAVRIR